MSEELKYYSVRFQTTNKSYTFSSKEDFKVGDAVIVETQRGVEYALISEGPFEKPNLTLEIKEITRKASEQDKRDFEENQKDAEEAKVICQEESDKLNLGMNIINAEYTLDRAKVTFTYLADDRVDFRELLKILASIFRCRIDLRQVGIRDKAKMVSGIGICGRELCCAKFVNEFDRISINFAKNQMLALNVQKLSGQCGSLMCCLKFEDAAYKDARKDLPRLNSRVDYNGEKFKITSMNVISKTCKLENADHTLFVSIEDVKKFGKFDKNEPKEDKEEEVVSD